MGELASFPRSLATCTRVGERSHLKCTYDVMAGRDISILGAHMGELTPLPRSLAPCTRVGEHSRLKMHLRWQGRGCKSDMRSLYGRAHILPTEPRQWYSYGRA